jgi:hypothetical protein
MTDVAQHQHPHYNPDPHAHPGLACHRDLRSRQGPARLVAASGLEILGPAPLQRWLHELINRFQLDPHHGAIDWLSHVINPGSVHLAARSASAMRRCVLSSLGPVARAQVGLMAGLHQRRRVPALDVYA